MNQRILTILSRLQDNTQLQSADLLEEFHISSRTLRNDIREMNDIFLASGLEEIITKKGVLYPPESRSLLKEFIEQETMLNYRLLPEQRIPLCACAILNAKVYITMA